MAAQSADGVHLPHETELSKLAKSGQMKTDAWSGEFPALAKAGQPDAAGAGGAVRSKSRSVIIDFREAHRINKVLYDVGQLPRPRLRRSRPALAKAGNMPHIRNEVIDRRYSHSHAIMSDFREAL